jgi:hypothetical protein
MLTQEIYNKNHCCMIVLLGLQVSANPPETRLLLLELPLETQSVRTHWAVQEQAVTISQVLPPQELVDKWVQPTPLWVE